MSLFNFCSYELCPLMKVGCWNLPLLLCDMQYMLWALVRFLLWMQVPLHLEHRYSGLRVHLVGLFLRWIWSVLPYLFWKLLVESWFYSIWEWLLQLFSLDHLLGKLFSSNLLWGNVCHCHLCRFPVCSKYLVLFKYPLCLSMCFY